jgi:diguanylate cyclase (GGDEF)-like protein/PAS domain S-box-containing protein
MATSILAATKQESLSPVRLSQPPNTAGAWVQLQFLERILDALDAPFYVIRAADYSIVLANRAARARGVGKASKCHELTHHRPTPCSGGDHPCPLEGARLKRGPCVVEHVHYDGAGRPYQAEVHGYPIYDAEGGLEYFVEYSLDITARKAAEEQLLMFQRAFEHTASSVVITNARGLIKYVNPAFERITGYSSREAVGNTPRLLKSGQHSAPFYADLWSTIKRGEVWRGEMTNRRKDGETYWEQMTIAPIKDAGGTVTHFVAVKEDITARKRVAEELERLASTDPLTGLPNRRYFFQRAESVFASSGRPVEALSVVMVDIDHFKSVNDRFGHAGGDAVLRETAARLQRAVRADDLIARFGGEEFALLLPRTDERTAFEVAERLRLSVASGPLPAGTTEVAVTVSLGVAGTSDVSVSIDELLQRADVALYAAKEGGRNRSVLHTGPVAGVRPPKSSVRYRPPASSG